MVIITILGVIPVRAIIVGVCASISFREEELPCPALGRSACPCPSLFDIWQIDSSQLSKYRHR